MITPFWSDHSWFPEIHAPSDRATKKVKAITVNPMECNCQGSNSKGHEKHPTDYLEDHIAMWVQTGIKEESARKVTDSWIKRTKQNYQWMFEHWWSLCHKRGLPFLTICVDNLVEYLDYLQVTHDYAYMTLCMPASAICRILQPTGQTRVSMAPLVEQLLKGVFRKKTPARVLADTWDEGPRPTTCLGKAFGLEWHSTNLEDSHDLCLCHGQESIRSESV